MDLIPLVQDGVAAGDSVSAVEQHIQSCPQCRAMWEGQIPHSADSGRILEKVRHRTRVFMGMVLMFGIFFGLSLTAGSGLFLNSLIMPVIGSIGYCLFRWKSAVVRVVRGLCSHRDGDRRPAAHCIPKGELA